MDHGSPSSRGYGEDAVLAHLVWWAASRLTLSQDIFGAYER